MRRTDFLHRLRRHTNEKAATVHRTESLEHSRALLLRAIQRDSNGSERRLIDVQTGVGQGAQRRREINQARFEQHARLSVSHRTLQSDFQRRVL